MRRGGRWLRTRRSRHAGLRLVGVAATASVIALVLLAPLGSAAGGASGPEATLSTTALALPRPARRLALRGPGRDGDQLRRRAADDLDVSHHGYRRGRFRPGRPVPRCSRHACGGDLVHDLRLLPPRQRRPENGDARDRRRCPLQSADRRPERRRRRRRERHARGHDLPCGRSRLREPDHQHEERGESRDARRTRAPAR